MSWKNTTGFLKKLTMDDYNKVMHDIDEMLLASPTVKYRYSDYMSMNKEVKARQEQEDRPRTPNEERQEAEKWGQMHPEAVGLLLKVGNRQVSASQFTQLYQQLAGEEILTVKVIEWEITSLDGYFRDIDTSKITKFFTGTVEFETNEAIVSFLDCIAAENIKPLITVIARVEDAFWHNKLNEEQVGKIKRYILTKYIVEHGVTTRRRPFAVSDMAPRSNARLDVEDLRELTIKAHFMRDAYRSILENSPQDGNPQKDMQAAMSKNAPFIYRNIQKDYFFNFVYSGLKVGMYNVRLQQLTLLKQLPDKELTALFGEAVTSTDSKIQLVDALIQSANTMKKAWDALAIVTNPF